MFKIILLTFALIIAGCSSKNEGMLSYLNIDEQTEKALNYTKSAQIVNSLELRAKITATYLNPLYPDKYKDGEYFFVGVYIPGDYGKPKPEDVNRTDYRLVLKSKDGNSSALSAEIVDKKSHFFKSMPHTDNWSRYYVVGFKGLKPKVYNMTLVLISEEYGTAQMDFVK